MAARAMVCPKCGASLPPEARRRVVVCAYCGTSVFIDRHLVMAADYRHRYERSAHGEGVTWRIVERDYRVLGRIATGHSRDVFLAERIAALPERVVVKVLRASEDEELARNERRVLDALASSAAGGAAHFRHLVPELVVSGDADVGAEEPRLAVVTRWASGFVHTLDDVRAQHGTSLDARHGIWIWRRLLELLAWIHRSGWAHGALLPQHVLVHARDHGVRLVGFSLATKRGEPPPGRVDPEHGMLHSGPGGDVGASARLVGWLLGGDGRSIPDRVPAPLAELLRREAGADASTDALALAEEVGRAARAIYGPPKFVPLAMPGW